MIKDKKYWLALRKTHVNSIRTWKQRAGESTAHGQWNTLKMCETFIKTHIGSIQTINKRLREEFGEQYRLLK